MAERGGAAVAPRGVGPVLQANALGRAVLAAIQQLNPGASVLDRGAYYRVAAPPPCVLTRAAVEQITGEPFELPGDLEQVMPSFEGCLRLARDRAEWSLEPA
jgi:hypothetical protein